MSFLDLSRILAEVGYYSVDDEELIPSLKDLDYIPDETPDVPSSVRDWIRSCKQVESHEVSLSFALNPTVWRINHLSNECQEWLYSSENQKTFALLWISCD
jgi:gp178